MKKPVKQFIRIAVILLAVSAGYLSYENWVKKEPLPEGLIQANGRIEGDHVTVAGKFAGKIKQLTVKEGDSVTAGQVMAYLDDPQVKARVEQARQAVLSLESQIRSARKNLEILKKEVPLSIEIAEANVVHSRAVIDKATAKKTQDQRDATRFRELYEAGTVDKHQSEMADLASTVSGKELVSSQTALVMAEKQLANARLGWDRIKAAGDGLDVLIARRRQAEAVLSESQSVLDDFKITAPSSGIITTRLADAGEVVAAGSPLFDIVDLDRLYLKVYVPEIFIGKLRFGLPARIYIDAYPGRYFDAKVKYIASNAQFTPKEVQTPDERVKLVYAVKLYLKNNPDHSLSPGLPADAIIQWKEGASWAAPQW